MDRIGPGSLLAGRYRLQEQVQADAVTELWRAEDVTLERPVAVRVLSATHPRVQTTLDAARRAALVDDPRLQRVFGVGVEAGVGYVVLEWVTGQDAGALAGKVSEQEALRIVVEAAESLRTAASRELHHGRLGPRQVVRASDGRVRVIGTAVDVAASGQATPAAAARPESRDVRDLSAVLYALLTGSWPFGVTEGLPAAPTEKGRPVGSRTLRTDVSAPLDALLTDVLAGTGPESLDGLVGRLQAVRADGGATGAQTAGQAGGSAGGGRAPEADTGDTDVLTPVRPGGSRGTAGGGAAARAAAVGGVAAAAGAGAVGGAAAGGAAAGRAAAGGASAAGGAPAAGAAAAAGGASAAGGAAAAAARAAGSPGSGAGAAGAGPAGGPVAGAGPAAGSGSPFGTPPTDPARTAAYPVQAAPTGYTPRTPAYEQEDDGWDLLPVGDQPWEDQGWEAAQPWDEERQPWDDQPWDERGYDDRDGDDPRSAAAVLPYGRRGGGRRPAGAGTGVAVVLVMGAFVVGTLVWALDRVQEGGDVAAPGPVVTQTVQPSVEPSAPASEAPPPPPDAPTLVSPAGVQALDPQGDGEENDQEAPRAIDGDPTSSWQTQRYNSRDFGNLKTGLGLAFDLGAPAEVQSVTVSAPGVGGTYEVRAATGPAFDGSTVIATGETGPEPSVLTPEVPATTQFVVVWFTALPELDGDFRGAVSEVQVQIP